MKKQKFIFKTVKVLTLVFTLLEMQLMNVAYAVNPNDIAQGLNIVNNIGQNILNQKMQLQSQQIAQMQMQNIQKQLQPKTLPSKYFPECMLPQAMQAMPQNVCMQTNDPNKMVANLGAMYGYETFATKMVNYFDQMTNEVANSPIGMSCLNNGKKNLDSQMVEMINNLTRLQTQMKEQSQQFRENNKALIADLEETNSELMGNSDPGSARNNVKIKTQDFSKIVSQECQSVLGDTFGAASEMGFNGLLKNMGPKNKAAISYTNSSAQIQSEIQAQVQKMKNSITSDGLDMWAAPDGSGQGFRGQVDIAEKLSSYPAMARIMAKEVTNLQTQRAKIANALSKLKYTLPEGDKNLSSSLATSIGSVQSDFRTKYIDDCTLNADRGVAIDFNKVLGSIEQLNTNNSPMAINGYKTALQNIMNSDDSLDTKLKNIRALEVSYKGMTVSYTDFSGSKITETPFDLLTKTKANCEQKYKTVEEPNAKSAQSLIQDYKNLTDSFPSKLGNSIVDTIINCNGESLKSTDKCDENTLNPAAAGSFCMAKASTCAQKMNACYSEMNTAVEKRKTKMNGLAFAFNKNVEKMVNNSNALFKAQTANVENLTKMIQQKFPGSNFEIPKDLFITLPPTSKDKFGIDLVSNGDMDKILAELPTKIDSLKEMFGNQKTAMDAQIDDYTAKIRDNMSKEKSRFEALLSTCKSAASATEQALNRMNQDGAKAQNETNKKVAQFCRKYDALRNNPTPACGKVSSLGTDIDGVMGRISQNTANVAQQFEYYCDQLSNESLTALDPSSCDNLKDKAQADCLKLLANKSQASLTNKPQGSKSAPKVKLSDLCGKKDNINSDDDFIKKAISKMSKTEKDSLPKDSDGKNDVEKIKETLLSGDVEKLNSSLSSIFADISIPSSNSENKDKQICTGLYSEASKSEYSNNTDEIAKAKKASDDATSELAKVNIAKGKIAGLKTNLEEAKKAMNVPGLKKDDANYAPLNDAYENAKKELNEANSLIAKESELQKALSAAETDLQSKKDKTNTSKFDKLLTDAFSNASDATNEALAKWQRIGQQDTGSCDSMMNTALAKNPMDGGVLNYAQQRLGTAGAVGQ